MLLGPLMYLGTHEHVTPPLPLAYSYLLRPAGVGLGSLISKCTKLRDEQFIAAAEAVARLVTEDDLNRGQLLPSLKMIREVSRWQRQLWRHISECITSMHMVVGCLSIVLLMLQCLPPCPTYPLIDITLDLGLLHTMPDTMQPYLLSRYVAGVCCCGTCGCSEGL
jgi:hypothetical protein